MVVEEEELDQDRGNRSSGTRVRVGREMCGTLEFLGYMVVVGQNHRRVDFVVVVVVVVETREW